MPIDSNIEVLIKSLTDSQTNYVFYPSTLKITTPLSSP